MRYQIILAFFASLFACGVNAQQGEVVDVDLQAEIVRETQVSAPQDKIIILGQPQVTTAQVQQQPITNVEASPLSMSRAEQLRKARRDAELGTEQTIVEKLEESRLQDEKRRANALFGNAQLNNVAEEQQVQQVQAVEAVEAAPAVDTDALKADIVNTIREEISVEDESKEESEMYVSAQVGLASYNDLFLNALDNRISTGFSVGQTLDSGFTVEGSFLYSNFFITEDFWYFQTPLYEEMEQYNFAMSVKYSPLKGRIRPQIGALASYTYRVYEQRNILSEIWYGNSFDQTQETDAFDIGFIAALDVQLSDNFLVGAEYKYITNVSSFRSSPFQDNMIRNGRIGDPIEELDYSIVSIVGKVLF